MNEIVKVAKAFIKKNKTYPSMVDLSNMGISKDKVRHHFGTLNSVHDALFKECSDDFIDLTREKLKSINVKNYKTFIITTALTGDDAHADAINSIKTFCKHNKAACIVQVAKGSAKFAQTLDAKLRDFYIVTEDTQLNINLKLIGIFQSGLKTDPTSGGISRLGSRESSMILPSPKNRLFYTATGIDKLPHATIGTGAITLPKYNSKQMSGYVASHDHVMGAVVVEIVDNKYFHYRHITFDKNGEFIDMGKKYSARSIKSTAPAAMVLGDWHAGETDPVVAKASFDLSEKLKINTWILHDTFDAKSVSHHDMGKQVLLTKKAEKHELNLESELKILAADLKKISEKIKNVIIVKSNHDEHLERYLDEGRFVKDPHNMKISVELVNQLIQGNNVLSYAVNKFVKIKNNLKWLNRGESFQVAGIECGLHGDVGPNGSRGSLAAFEKCYGNVVVGHSHTPGILRGAWCVGTSTATSPDYGRGGASSWLNTHCLIYPNGQRQLINCINGKFTAMV